ncbi:hypothetical protein POTOM_029509 [Populus tomentosa]|uniref:Uncharacterized protein n=1 Tax=Populus tomentosa TaxID=118781 RepID=A0A8X7ZAC5_POPTO|nr:hypothetical protein POTOM_029509 [Populus tomentosa]
MHAVKNEHLGISVDSYMAAGAVPIGHPLFSAQAQLLDSLKSQNSLCLLLNVTRSGRKREETMSISLNSAVGFKSTVSLRPKAASLDAGVKGHGGAESSIYDNQLSAVNSPIEDSPVGNNVGEESGPQTSGASNGSTISVDMKSRPKRLPLTARERLKAARVISRYTESKTSKSEMGRKVLDALRESDKGKKRSGLPEAPENLFDESNNLLGRKGENEENTARDTGTVFNTEQLKVDKTSHQNERALDFLDDPAGIARELKAKQK